MVDYSVPVTPPMADPKAVALIKRFKKMQSNRVNWEAYWEELARFFVPQKNNIYGSRMSGQKLENMLYDSESVHSVELLASALHGMLTNPSLNWFGLSSGDEKLDEIKSVRQWLQGAVNRMIMVLNNSNFQTEIHELYIDLVSFGTGKMAIYKDDETGVRFSCGPIYDSYIEENNKGTVDTVFTEKEWTVRQIVMEFGEKIIKEKAPDVWKKYENDPECKEKILHCVMPRDTKSKSRVPKKMAFASFHIYPKGQQILRESGFRQNLFAVPRWTKLSNEMYGRSPAMKCLSDVKSLNAMVKAMIQQGQLTAAPPVQAPDDGLLSPVRFVPNGVTFYRSGTKDRVEPLNISGNMAVNDKLIQMFQDKIAKAFFINQLQLNEGPQMTATEVNQRTEEKLRLLGPILGRLHNELLKPIIDRVFEIMMDEGMFDEAPAELSGKQLEIQYTSQIAKAQKVSEADTFPRFLGIIAPMVQIKPEMLDNMDSDALYRYYAGLLNLPEQITLDPAKVRQLREGRAQQQQAMMANAQEQHDAEVSSKVAPNMLKAQELQREE